MNNVLLMCSFQGRMGLLRFNPVAQNTPKILTVPLTGPLIVFQQKQPWRFEYHGENSLAEIHGKHSFRMFHIPEADCC